MISLRTIQELEASPPHIEDYIVFGGSFDPIHEGHVAALRRLLKCFSKVIIAVTFQNPHKQNTPAPSHLRRKFVADVLLYENLQASFDSEGSESNLLKSTQSNIIISQIDYTYAQEIVSHYRNKLAGNLHWAVGEDIKDTILSWKNWDILSVPTIVVPIDIPIHSQNVRHGEHQLHQALTNNKEAISLYK